MDDVEGVHFAVWAPEAKRVSVVGEFNYWNGKRHQMNRVGKSGLYELFIPGVKTGTKYKFEVKTQNGDPMLKADPYAFLAELRPDTASVVHGLGRYSWKDQEWMEHRRETQDKEKPFSIYEVHLGSWMQKPVEKGDDGRDRNGSQFYTYRELGENLVSYVREMGYTHVELMPVMEHPLDASWGYQVTSFYAPTSRFGTPDEFRALIDLLHGEGIGVILDWVPTQFAKDAHGLAAFDGTCLYEHRDPRQGENKTWDTLIFNYGRPQVSNFLISNALYWAKEFHADGIRLSGVESMLYLDYGKSAGEWIANMYGGHENLEAVEFLKHLNSIFHKEIEGALTIAEESTAWPRVTEKLEEDGLGFDYKWNHGWTSDVLRYMKQEPQYRHQNYGDLTFGMLYAYSEDFMLAFSHDEVVHGKSSLLEKMPGGSTAAKMANLRAAFGFFFGHPGKKLLFMGQDFAQTTEWTETREPDREEAKQPLHAQMSEYVRAWNRLYRSEPALFEMDYDPKGFEWINCMYDKENIVAFLRHGKDEDNTLLFVCNFGENDHETFRVGVPSAGRYKEILNSDASAFGGMGRVNTRLIEAESEQKDGRADSIAIRLAPMTVCVFSGRREDGKAEVPMEKTEESLREIPAKDRGIISSLPIHPAKTAKAAGEAIAQKGADALDKLSVTVGKMIKKK